MTLMERIDSVIADRQFTVNSKQSEVSSKPSVDRKLLTDEEIEYCLKEVKDLINPKYKAWYIKRLFKLGPTEFLLRADKSRKYGNDPQKHFSYIIKAS